MEKYLLFAFLEYYPCGGMDDCVFVADNIDELNLYAMQYIEDNNDDFDHMHYYDCNSGKTYEAEFEEKKMAGDLPQSNLSVGIFVKNSNRRIDYETMSERMSVLSCLT